ncbi:MAG: SDR family NAD(P)-dependent oxidoreductase [Alphaproteobacteria bacterium]|jgi:NAD(P)-dependent dehydrogenase (short-subunit alcohol dehydrogenase family)|nr:hypothetical protein [Rhodospirillaceae bacterium]MDP6404826.1 SDR family NAD(P)-dependent oxidoreductase [Alphaproteobacteria bacterium]
MSEGFAGRTGIVTGASKGIGAAIARALVAAGAKTALFDVDDDAGQAVADELGANAAYWSVDVADWESADTAVEEVAERFGSVDFLVNNAGIAPPRTLANIPDGDWERVLGVNLTGAFNCTRASVPYMKEAGGGAIVNISSVAGKNISMMAGMHYTTSKWGLIGFSRHMAYELAQFGIRVNIVCPGPTLTTLVEQGMDAEKRAANAENFPLGRWVMPDDIANAVMFFLGPGGAMCAGAELIVDGGILIGSGGAYPDYMSIRGDQPAERKIVRPEE